jgi:hypothetical protein
MMNSKFPPRTYISRQEGHVLQTRLLVREGTPHQQARNCLKNYPKENGKNWSRVPDGCLIPRRNITLTLTSIIYYVTM